MNQFVLLTLLGRPIRWKAQCRIENAIRWREAVSAHGCSALFVGGWVVAMFLVNPAVHIWLLPVCVALSLSVPLSVYLSQPSLGQAAKRLRLFQIPEESSLPPVAAATQSIYRRRRENDCPGGRCLYIDGDGSLGKSASRRVFARPDAKVPPTKENVTKRYRQPRYAMDWRLCHSYRRQTFPEMPRP